MVEFIPKFVVPVIVLICGLFIEYWFVQPLRKSYESKQKIKLSVNQPNNQRANPKNGFMKALAWIVVGKADANLLTSLLFGFVELIFSIIRWAIVGGIIGIVFVAFIWIVSVGVDSTISGIQEVTKNYAILGGVIGTISRIIFYPLVINISNFKKSKKRNTFTKTSIPSIGLSISPLEYFCYISESKVNQLYSQLPVEITRRDLNIQKVKRIVELRKEIALVSGNQIGNTQALIDELEVLEASHNLLSIGYGKHSEVNSLRELTDLEGLDTLMPKLRVVLNYIFKEKKVINLESTIANHNHMDAFCYYYSGLFHFKEFAEQETAIITSRIHKYELQLYCSMKYFSDMAYFKKENGRWYAQPHSSNMAFFSKAKPEYFFKSLVFLTSVKDQNILGSPLFNLKL